MHLYLSEYFTIIHFSDINELVERGVQTFKESLKKMEPHQVHQPPIGQQLGLAS